VIAFLVDQNFDEHIVDGLTRRDVTLKFTQVRDVGLAAAPDPALLEWAAMRSLVLLTHDRKTIPPFAHARVAAGLPNEQTNEPTKGKTPAKPQSDRQPGDDTGEPDDKDVTDGETTETGQG
jgi:hypothetical protein